MRKTLVYFGLFLLLISGAFCLFATSIYLLFGEQVYEKGDIALIEIKGPLYSAYSIIKKIEKVRNSDDYKGLIIRVNSPGGTVAASQEVHDAILDLQSHNKKVVISMETVAASGAYYLSAPADWIIANPGTITGSIGVRLEYMNIQELLAWAKLKRKTLKSGKLKDIASPIRPMTLEEQTFLENLLLEMHDQFKGAIVAGRGIPRADVDAFADGRILSGRQALKLKLVDALGSYQVAVQKIGELSGIVGEPKVVLIPDHKEHFLDYLFQSKLAGIFQSLIGKDTFEVGNISTKPLPVLMW
jgi:protease IV